MDPGILELLGELADLLGLAERIQRFLPTQRLKVQRKHRRVETLLDSFNETLNDARTALRVVSSSFEQHLPKSGLDQSSVALEGDSQLPRIAFSIPIDELPVYRRGVEQLQGSIQKLTKVAFDLEATSAGISDEVQRYYKISQSGNSVLRLIKQALEDQPEVIPELLRKVESYLTRCSQILGERQKWLEE